MPAMIHDRLDGWWMRRAGAVDLDPDLDARIVRCLAAFDQRLADLFERLFDRHALGQTVGPHLDSASTDVGGQLDELLAGLDLFPDLAGVDSLELARRAAAPRFDARIGESLLHLLALLRSQGGLHPMFVRGA